MSIRIPYGRQDICQRDIDTVIDILRSDWLTQGPFIEKFETTIAGFCGAKHAVAVSSGTAALHIACAAMGLKKGGRLWTSPNTFVASSNCGLYCGAEVDFVDIDPRTYNMSHEALEEKLRAAKKSGRLPDIVVPVHFAGQSCLMDRIKQMSVEYGFKVLEDAAHAIGGRYKDSFTGSCKYSEAVVFSFHPVKLITTGEGGMILTNDTAVYEKLLRFRTIGITRDSRHFKGPSHGPWYYEQLELGYHYRITDIQAALGISQFERLPEFGERRRFLAARYNKLLASLPVTLPWQHPDTCSPFHLYVIRLKLDKIRKTHRAVFEQLRSDGIGVNLHYIPVYKQPVYKQLGFNDHCCPEAEKYYSEAITIPLYYGLSEKDQDCVVGSLRHALLDE